MSIKEYLLFPNSNDLQKSKNYLQYIIGLYITWFHKHNLDIPLDYSVLKFLGPDIAGQMDTLNLTKIDNGQREGSNSERRKIPERKIKEFAKKTCEALINEKVITTVLEEKKSDKSISDLVIPELGKDYKLSDANKRTIHQYFRKLELKLEKDNNSNIVVIDTYITKNKKV